MNTPYFKRTPSRLAGRPHPAATDPEWPARHTPPQRTRDATSGGRLHASPDFPDVPSPRRFRKPFPLRAEWPHVANILILILIGGLAGWLAGKLMRGRGHGLVINVFVGVLGAVLGGFLFRLINVSFGGFFGELFTALIGAMVLLSISRLLGGRR